MPLNINDLKIHDRTDGDLIVINKSKLAHTFEQLMIFAHSSAGWISALGFSITFFLAAFVTENFKSFGPVTGGNIRSVVLMLGIVAFLLSIRLFTTWLRLKKNYTPDELINSMLDSEAKDFKTVFGLRAEKPKSIKRSRA